MQAKTTMSDDIYNKIKDLIINRDIKPGEKINQNKLAQELNSSRTPVVKALFRLASDGMLENIPNRGFYVHELTLYEVRDLFYLRQTLDRLIVTNIIQRDNTDQVKDLIDLFSQFVECQWDKEITMKYWEADKYFHNQLIKLCDNHWVHKIEDSFQVYGRVYKEGLLREPQDTLKEHLKIIEAIQSKNQEFAAEVIHEHTQITIDYIEEKIKQLLDLGFNPSEENIHRITKDKKVEF